MTAQEWIERFAAEVGANPPSDDEFNAMLDLAAVAAHDSERVAAPVACWIGGASGRSLDELQAIAKRIAQADEPA
ncbi:MAG TPA: DUF6457 domain-containing protein [Solirubrobacterales bacterium]|jgi:hypothetical protein|nr:DUF6457 domain-containing protein [Solirubrobacterales bacterium]